MRRFILKYQPFLLFLTRFVLVYIVLVLGYKMYLNQFDAKQHQVDDITYKSAQVSSHLLQNIGLESHIENYKKEASVLLFIKEKPVVRIIEGCNSISVIVLFIAFVISFSGPWVKTILFTVLGSFLIFVLNLIRMVIITIALYYLPQYESFLHDIVFPLLIYSVVFILWIVWINKFSYHAKDLIKTS